MQVTKTLKAAALASLLIAGSAQALPFVSFELGGSIGVSIDTLTKFDFGADTAFSYGAYGRVWFKPGMFRIAPFVKWENATGIALNSLPGLIVGSIQSNHNIQYGGLIGFEFLNITPYAGVSYSQFTDALLENTWALNYGVKFKIPIIPMTVGIDGSYQKPQMLLPAASTRIEMHRISATLGFQF